MNKWRHLFIDGEFASRSRLLSGLTREQVVMRPPGIAHSIYDELWHITKWQSIVVHRDHAAAAAWNAPDQDFPLEPPASESAWQELVAEFLAGSAKAVEWGDRPDELASDTGDGGTFADELECLAVHNAYHLGKIVALRQAIGAWPPVEE